MGQFHFSVSDIDGCWSPFRRRYRCAIYAFKISQLLLTPPGVVSILLFWGMMEIGVAMIAICLPTLRPILQNRSLESVVRSVRSAISLRSMGSDHKSPPTAEEVVARSESETAITGPPRSGLEYWDQSSLDMEIYAMGEIVGKKAQTRTAGPATLKETQILHSSEIV